MKPVFTSHPLLVLPTDASLCRASRGRAEWALWPPRPKYGADPRTKPAEGTETNPRCGFGEAGKTRGPARPSTNPADQHGPCRAVRDAGEKVMNCTDPILRTPKVTG